jgi:hypothetical protein
VLLVPLTRGLAVLIIELIALIPVLPIVLTVPTLSVTLSVALAALATILAAILPAVLGESHPARHGKERQRQCTGGYRSYVHELSSRSSIRGGD